MSRRQEMLAAAYEILGADGLEGLHARTVAQKVGVNHAAVHYHFPHRTDLLIGILEYSKERLEADRQRFVIKQTTPVKKFEAEIALIEAYCRPQSRFFRVFTSLFVAAQTEIRIRDPLLATWEAWRGEVSDSCRAAGKSIRKGSVFADPVILFAAAIGTGIYSQLAGPHFDSSACFDQVIDDLIKK